MHQIKAISRRISRNEGYARALGISGIGYTKVKETHMFKESKESLIADNRSYSLTLLAS